MSLEIAGGLLTHSRLGIMVGTFRSLFKAALNAWLIGLRNWALDLPVFISGWIVVGIWSAH